MRQSRTGLNVGGPTSNSASGNCASVSPASLSLSSSSSSSSSPSSSPSTTATAAAPPMDSSNSSFLYRKSYPNSDSINGSFSSSSIAGSIQDEHIMNNPCMLTQAELEEYSRLQYIHHQKQSSYAQSEGYHSYVSSTDSTSATPFLDRLRQDSELLSRSSSQHWSTSDLQTSASTTNIADTSNHSSESTSSTETLKWLGSMSDISISSHATNSSHISGSVASSQLIVHSSRVRTPKRHNSESVLYLNEDPLSAVASDASKQASMEMAELRSSRSNHRLFPVSTYMEPMLTKNQTENAGPLKSPQSHNWQSVADRINELERQNSTRITPNKSVQNTNSINSSQNQKFTYLDPSKTTRVSNMTLKAFQKNAVQSYFERQQQTSLPPPADKDSLRASVLNGHGASNTSINSVGAGSAVPTVRPQSLPVNKTNNSMANLLQSPSRSSLPNKLSQIINITTQLSAQHQHQQQVAEAAKKSPNITPIHPIQHKTIGDASHSAQTSQIVPQQISLHSSRIMTIEQSNLQSANESGVPPPPPRRSRPVMPVRRTSSAAEYSAYRDEKLQKQGGLSKDLLGPMVMGPIISLDDWVPERPPKNPLLRIPSPDLPPPPSPLHPPENDVNTLNQDEPLPPPPPAEVMRHMRRQLSEPDTKFTAPNRRNSFAGSSTRKPFIKANSFDNMTPPILPRKSMEMGNVSANTRPYSSMSKSHSFQVTHQQPVQPLPAKAHKVILNGKLETANDSSPRQSTPMRKRTHNAPMSVNVVVDKSPNAMTVASPPLKPRMPIISAADTNNYRSASAIGNRIRSNSKASYLPRQSHEKLASDPDHGSYKLTLTSNEDCIHLPHNVFHDPIHTTKINNLPDVLPLGVKMKNASSRYGSNQNLKSSPNGIKTPPGGNDHHQSSPPPPPSTPQQQQSTASSPITSAYSLKSMFSFQSNNNKHRNGIDHNILTMSNNNINQMHMNANGPNAGDAMNQTSKFMSQSTIDLKKAQLMFTHEAIFQQQHQNGVNTRIAATESMGNLIDCTNRQSAPPFLLHQQHQQISNGRKSNAVIDSDMANHIAMNSNGLTASGDGNGDDRINRTDSLKENIDTITQLQAKLMSSQLHDTSDCGRDSIGDATIPEDDSFSADDTSSVSQLSSESLTSNDINEILDAEGVDAARPSSPTSAATQCQAESQCDDEGDVQIAIVQSLNETIMSDVGSQTDESILDSFSLMTSNKNGLPTKTVIVTRSRFADEFDCEKLTDALVQKLSPNDRLRHILAPKVYKSTGDYVTGLYNPQMASRCVKKDAATSTHRDQRLDLTENTPLNGSYYSITEPSQSFTKQMNASRFHREMTLINGDVCDLTKQKEELVIRLTKQLVALTNDRTAISDQSTTNDLLGTDIASVVGNKVRPSESTKFRSYVDDVGHITMLLLSLSGRLARTENSLFTTTDVTEKKLLDGKRARLLEQLEEAKRLKIDIDRRGKNIASILEKSLSPEEYIDYDYFINTKAKLIVDSREVSDRIQLHEEQLNALKDTLVHSEC